ncbi:hypothetical protein [Aeromonas molluscorum]|nr:hypothetical protein [Aeromonas molluscorum]
MTNPHTRDLSAARPRGCASIKPIPPQFSSESFKQSLVLLGEGVA